MPFFETRLEMSVEVHSDEPPSAWVTDTTEKTRLRNCRAMDLDIDQMTCIETKMDL